jgi:hypothetical protein
MANGSNLAGHIARTAEDSLHAATSLVAFAVAQVEEYRRWEGDYPEGYESKLQALLGRIQRALDATRE